MTPAMQRRCDSFAFGSGIPRYLRLKGNLHSNRSYRVATNPTSRGHNELFAVETLFCICSSNHGERRYSERIQAHHSIQSASPAVKAEGKILKMNAMR